MNNSNSSSNRSFGALNSNNESGPLGQFLDRHLDESTLSSDSDDAGLELDSQLQFSANDSTPAARSTRTGNVLTFNNFPDDWNENEEENNDDSLPWNLEQMTTSDLKQLANQLYERVANKTNTYPERIARNTEADLSVVLEEFKRNFASLLELVNTENLDDDEAEEIDEKLEQLDEKKNILFGRLNTLRQKKERCADLILRFRHNSNQDASRLLSAAAENEHNQTDRN